MSSRFSLRPRVLLAFTPLALSACNGCDSEGRTREDFVDDAGTDASLDASDASTPDIPGSRPVLERAGQVVPLLYGRWVELERTLEGLSSITFVPLDDPSHANYDALFWDLTLACRRDVESAMSAPSGAIAIPGCGREGVFDARVALCRAEAALAFSSESSRTAITLRDGRPALDLAGDAPSEERLWTAASQGSYTTASWAMYAVAELRSAVVMLARVFDGQVCGGDLSEPALPDQRETLAEVAAGALADATMRVPAATARADDLLASRLETLLTDAGELDEAGRIAFTRALNDSLLERMKLYAAVPYGAFSSAEDAEPSHRARYPLLPAPDAAREASALLLTHVAADALTANRQARGGEALLTRFFAALRETEPLAFGSLGEGEAEEALSRFGLTLEALEQGAEHLAATARATGLPLGSEPSPSGLRLGGLAHVQAPGPSGYAYALTEAVATLSDDEASYGHRGLAHTLELASRAARRAAERVDLGDAEAVLRSIEPHEGRVRMCTTVSAGAVEARVELRGLPARELASYALYRGEDAVTCALNGVLAGVSCVHAPGALASEQASDTRAFVVEGDDERPDHLYLVKSTDEGASVVAALSLAPLDAPAHERCAELPLSDTLHAALGRIHAESSMPNLPRTAPALSGSLAYELANDTPVPLTFERDVSLTDGDVTTPLRLSPAVDAVRVALEAEIVASCARAPYAGTSEDGTLCDATPFLALHRIGCLADTVSSWTDLGRGAIGAWAVGARTQAERLSLALWAFELRQKELAALALTVRDFTCEPSARPLSVPGGDQELEGALWARIEAALADLDARYLALRTGLQEAIAVDPDLEPRERLVREVRALHGSRLAAARLVVATPYGAYEHDSDASLLEHAFTRFPVVAAPASTAEDTRIEGLIRTSGVHPLLPDLTVNDGLLAEDELEAALRRGELTTRLRTRLAGLDAERYGSSPDSPAAFLAWLGVNQYELESAVARMAQLSEARALSLLPHSEGQLVLARGLEPASPAPKAHHLYALTEGRAHLARDAFATSRAMGGYFHALAFVYEALAARSLAASEWSSGARAGREAFVAALSERLDGPRAALSYTADDAGEPELALEVTLPAHVSLAEAREHYELVWTDAGLQCALHGTFAGSPCVSADFRFDDAALEVSSLGTADARVRLAGFRFPAPSGWDPALSQEPKVGRVYALERDAAVTRVIGALTLGARGSAGESFASPPSSAWASELESLLGYREPGAGCEGCLPASVCETARCELGVCLREPVLDGAPCGASACVAGVCAEPGCGDGARADGSAGVPFEACDDGNLNDGDGCSAVCEVERRALEPLVKEAYPAGPAPAIAIDGLGQALIVYRKDALALGDDNAPIQASRFDAFGVPQGLPLTIEPHAARGSLAQPTAAGLRDGGFVVVYASADVEGLPGIAYRLVSASGTVSEARAVEATGSLQLEPRVVGLGDGFVVAFVERSAGLTRARLRMRRFDAQGTPVGPSSAVAASSAAHDQQGPTLASSQGQLLVGWSESTGDGANVGVLGRRYTALGVAVDDRPLVLAAGSATQPSATMLGSGDYAVAFRTQGETTRGDIAVRLVRRFGPPLESASTQLLVASQADESLPVLAGARGESHAVVYQAAGHANLFAPSIDAVSAAEASALLAGADQRDASAVAAPQGIWLTWSERLSQSRALYALLLPFDAPPED